MSLYVPGENCWKHVRASRMAVIIDSEQYYTIVKQAMEHAKRSILIAGWDIDSRTRLIRSGDSADKNTELGYVLENLVGSNSDLNIHILVWDYAFIQVMERELWLSYKLGWKAHQNIHFRWDRAHPVGASHHQKIVVIDDQLAFCGGIDLSKWRWDTPEHRFQDPRRIDPMGKPYKPYHDVQLMMEGDAALALGDLFRERWYRSEGEHLKPIESGPDSVWPQQIQADFLDLDLAISRTMPEYNQYPEVREVERLYLDGIQHARNCIYIENQYTTSQIIAKALAARLQEKDGPEVVVVTHIESGGWLEQNTMDVLRSRWIKRLRQADRYGRFHIYYPHLPGYSTQNLTVHSKVMVVDDALMQVGSANLCNRSMGLDTECDISLESDEDETVRGRITRFRNSLLGEHCGIGAEGFA